jgi:hypothetical protein
MVGLKEQIFFGRCLNKCLAQAVTRNHRQIFQRRSYHHLYFLIRVKKGDQVLKKKKHSLLVWENWTTSFSRTGTSLAEEDDCSTSSSDDDDDTDDEYDEQELLVEFKNS